MHISVWPRSPVGNDDVEEDNDHAATLAWAAPAQTGPAGEVGFAVDEPEWYPPPDCPCM